MTSFRNYNKAWYYLLIPVTGVLLALLFNAHLQNFKGWPSIKYLLHAITMTSGLWIGCLLIVGFLWQKFPWEKSPVKHLIIEILSILVYTNGFSLALYMIETRFNLFEPEVDLIFSIAITNLVTFLITAIHEAIEFYSQWKYNFSRSVRLEKDNLEAKYEVLRTQVNPHFLFNSLNSLVSLVEDNEEAVKYISNLSDFLRYMLKSRDRQLVLLREEIQMLNRYLELQKLRFRENLQYKVDVDEKLFHYSTPPLVLQMLVENCIKHNIISSDKPLHIKITAEKAWLTVENNLQKKNDQESTGQGLRNISERYSFFTTEQIKINQTSSTFKVTIPLLLADYD